ncbi:MAG: DUF4214 domain-containing protein [Acidimicrobiales bacterium]|nr:DUF4214 domain-containing protein [Acidimicrobiales bacterium]
MASSSRRLTCVALVAALLGGSALVRAPAAGAQEVPDPADPTDVSTPPQVPPTTDATDGPDTPATTVAPEPPEEPTTTAAPAVPEASTTTVPPDPPQAQEAPAATTAAGCDANPFTSLFDQEVRRRWPGRNITAAAYDTRTGCQYRYRSALRITTASVQKTAIMAAVQLQAQRAGRGLTSRERSLIGPMIRTSDDPSSIPLWNQVGGVAGMTAFDRELGLDETREASPWGLTTTSAADRNELLRQLVLGQWGPFSASTRAEARAFLLDVTPSQRWGVTAGVPSSWKVPLKNGFYPSQCCRWRINTSGVIERPGGGAYVVTVLSDGWANDRQGIEAVEFVSRSITAWMLDDIGPFDSPARFARQAFQDLFDRRATFGEEQLVASAVGPSEDRAVDQLAALLSTPAGSHATGDLLRLYLVGLERLPNPDAWAHWLGRLRAGRPLLAIADHIAWSSEYSGGTPLTTGEFVDLAYQRTFGRAPDAAGRAWWIARIDSGRPRGELLVSLSSTNTFRWTSGSQVRVATSFLKMIRRLPHDDERATWEAHLAAGGTSRDVLAFLFDSLAYADRVR